MSSTIIPEIIQEPAAAGCAPGNETIGYLAGEISRLRSELNTALAVNMGVAGLTTQETYLKISEANALRGHIDELQQLLPDDDTISSGIRRLQEELPAAIKRMEAVPLIELSAAWDKTDVRGVRALLISAAKGEL